MLIGMDLHQRYSLLHTDPEAARAELGRLAQASEAGREVVVVSACVCGVRCAADGGERSTPDRLARLLALTDGGAEVVPLCPEVLGRMGVPRAALATSADGKRVTDARGRDVTDTVDAGARLADLFATQAKAARALLLDGSVSCGVTKVAGADGAQDGEGRLTARLKRRNLPVAAID
jgi:uncharacterized protein YbbK (DUF523 family)